MKRKALIILVLLLTVAFGFSARNYFEEEHHQLSSSENLSHWIKAKPDLSQLHSGDLIFRHGRGIISNALMSLGQREKKYSHVGIISVENGSVFVYHAIGGEENVSNRLRKDPLAFFCNPDDVHAFGIYRTDMNEHKLNAILNLVFSYYKSRLQFDAKFDLASDDKMYCTEFVYKVFQQALGNENYISLSALKGIKYIACDDLYCNPHSREIYHYQF